MQKSRLNWWIIGGILVAVGILAAALLPSRRAKFSLQDPNPAVRVAALRSLGYNGNVDLLIQGLQDQDADVRLVAAIQLHRRQKDAAPATDALIAALGDKHMGVRREAAEALPYIGAAAAPALVKALQDPDPRVRLGAIAGLGDPYKLDRERLPQERALVFPAMKKLLQDEDAKVRQGAAAFLKYHDESSAAEAARK